MLALVARGVRASGPDPGSEGRGPPRGQRSPPDSALSPPFSYQFARSCPGPRCRLCSRPWGRGGTSRHAVPSLPADSKALAASWEREEDARLSWAWKPDGPPAQERDEQALGVREGGPLTPPWAATDSTVPAAPLVQGFPGREKPGPGLC